MSMMSKKVFFCHIVKTGGSCTQCRTNRICEVPPQPGQEDEQQQMPLDVFYAAGILCYLAVGQNQWYHFGVGESYILGYCSGDWDVHWGYGLLTHGHLAVGQKWGNPKMACPGQWRPAVPGGLILTHTHLGLHFFQVHLLSRRQGAFFFKQLPASRRQKAVPHSGGISHVRVLTHGCGSKPMLPFWGRCHPF